MSRPDVSSGVSIPPPSISSRTLQLDEEGVIIQESVSRVAKPIFEAALANHVPVEAPSNTGSIEGSRVAKLWRPHNFRREVSTRRLADTGLLSAGGQYRDFHVSKKKIVTVWDYPNITLMHFRDTTVAIWRQSIIDGEKETFLLESDSWRGIDERVHQKVEETRQRMDAALNDFIDRFHLRIPGVPISWLANEEWTKTEDWKVKLPPSCIVYEECFKKVYRDGVEFTGGRGDVPGQKFLRFHRNLALLDLSPELEGELFALRREVAGLRKEFHGIKFIAVADGKAPTAASQTRLNRWS